MTEQEAQDILAATATAHSLLARRLAQEVTELESNMKFKEGLLGFPTYREKAVECTRILSDRLSNLC